ncbi:MAG: VIT domain-containing protein, partial [Candidatus Krumholzibacteriia bacterium]
MLCVSLMVATSASGQVSDAAKTDATAETPSAAGPLDVVPATPPSGSAAGPPIRLADVQTGELLWRTERGLVPLPMQDTDVSLDVSGIMVHGTVTQRFFNPSQEVIEALYVFPLPEDAAVHHMEMRIGSRRIVSIVQERQQARRTYERAKKQGKKAALVEQERPNLFTTSVANINPGQSVCVVLEYVEEAQYRDGQFSLTFPLTFTPRFVPEAVMLVEEATGRTAIVSSIVADADRVTPPFQESFAPTAPTASFRARIDAGMPLADVRCPSHPVRVSHAGEAVVVVPEASELLADRDVVLEWRPAV